MLPPLTACKGVVFCGFAALFFGTAAAQTSVPMGGETAVIEQRDGDQVFPAAALGTSGGIIVWQDAKIDGQGQGIGAQLLNASFLAGGAPFRVNQKTVGHQMHPSIARLDDGGAVVAWDTLLRGETDIFARFLRPDGTFLTSDLQVNPNARAGRTNHTSTIRGYKANHLRTLRFRLVDSFKITRDRSTAPQVVSLGEAGSVVVYSGWRRVQTNWTQIVTNEKTLRGRTYTNTVPVKVSAFQDWMQDVFLQRFDPRGRRIGDEVLVNEEARYNQRSASVTALPGGGFVVSYISEGSVLNLPNVVVSAGASVKVATMDVFARLYHADGEPAGHEFKINTAERPCATPVVSAMADGRFTVAWAERAAARSDSWDIHARVFSAAGVAEAGDFLVNTNTYGDQFAPKIASVGLNQFIVWTSLAQDGSREGVFGRALSSGLPMDGEIAVNTQTDSAQIHPTVAGDGAGCFLALWTTFNVGTSFDLSSQRYDTVQPTGVAAARAAGGTGIDAGLRMTWSGPLEKLRLNWPAATGDRYQVQTSTDLRNWTNVGSPRASAGAGDSIGIDVGAGTAFFRVVRVP